MKHYDDVDAFLDDATRWRDECAALRVILLDCGLSEGIKWGKPCFTHGGHNIAIQQPFKDFLALMFFRGALLDDPGSVLQSQGENTRSALRMCFTSVQEVAEHDATIRDFVAQAIDVAEQGLTVPERGELELVEELQAVLDADPALKAAFAALTPGRQREYHLHVSGAKRAETRERRAAQHVPRILAGKGLRDR